VDTAALRAAITEWVESGRRLLLLLQGVGTPAPASEPVGATRYEPELRISPELEARLKRMEAEIHAARGKDDS